jgi:hypothetical protein
MQTVGQIHILLTFTPGFKTMSKKNLEIIPLLDFCVQNLELTVIVSGQNMVRFDVLTVVLLRPESPGM